MKTTITITQFDNGISICDVPEDGNLDGTMLVSLEHTKLADLGRVIWDNVKAIMDSELTNSVKMDINFTTE